MGIFSRGGLILALCLQGCASTRIDVGIAAHTNSIDDARDNNNNPLGIIRVEHPIHKRLHIFYEHISAIDDKNEDAGLNMIGGTFKLK